MRSITEPHRPPPPIIQYWHREETPDFLDRASVSIGHHNPDSPHLLFNESTAAAFIEQHFTAREAAAFRACAVPAMQSDYFRYSALLALGGVYSDVDFFCTGSFRQLLDDAEAQLFRRPLGMVMNGFLVFRSPGHPFLRLTLDVVTANIERREMESITGVTGPLVLTALVMLYELGSIEAFLHVSRSPNNKWAPELIGEVVGDFNRVIEAFEGVRLSPMQRLRGCVANRDIPNAHEKHWTKWESSIYR